MEMLDVVDEDNNVIDTMSRKEVHEKGLLHRSVGVLVFRSEDFDEILLQQRGPDLRFAPGKWGDASGHVPAGMSLHEAALMELHEEMFHGMEMPDVELEELFTFLKHGDDDTEFRTVFRTVYDGPVNGRPGEVQDVKWVPVGELREDIEKNPDKYTGTFRDVWGEYEKG